MRTQIFYVSILSKLPAIFLFYTNAYNVNRKQSHVLCVTKTSCPVAKPDETCQKAAAKIKKAKCKIKYKMFSLSSSCIRDQRFSNLKFGLAILLLKLHVY